jgi:hypothetical protein
MARRHPSPCFKFSFSSEGITVQAFGTYGRFVAHLNLKGLTDVFRQSTTSTLNLILRTAKRVSGLFTTRISIFLWRCFVKAIQTIVTCIFILTFVGLAIPFFAWFLATPFAHQIGITLTTDEFISLVLKFLNLAL